MAKNNTPFNIIIVFLLAFALFGLYWLSRLGLEAGTAYLWLFIIGVVFILITVIAKLVAGIDFWFEIPIDKNNERSFLMALLGVITLLIFVVINTVSGLNIYSPFVMAPLASFGIGFGEQTFAALSAATDPFWTFFIVVISAAVIEELVLGFAFVKMGSLTLGYGLRKLLGLDFGNSGGEHSGNALWDFAGAMIFSVVLFGVLHYFNSTYVDSNGHLIWSMFLWAAGFRLILNILIYKFGNFGLSWSIGVHALNNAVFLGGATIIAALSSFPGGIIIDILILLFLYFGIISIKKVFKEGVDTSKDFITFD